MTRRQQIAELLKQRSYSAKSLADIFGVAVKDIVEDLNHISLSVRPQQKLKVEPASCRSCGFAFKDRGRLNKPSRCPKCNSEWIEEQKFRVE